MTAVWPDVIPQCPILNGFSEQRQRNLSVFKPEVGQQKIRRRSTAAGVQAACVFRMTNDDLVEFNYFFEIVLQDGSLPFVWPHPVTNVQYVWSFDSGEAPRIDRMTPNTFRVTFNLLRFGGGGPPVRQTRAAFGAAGHLSANVGRQQLAISARFHGSGDLMGWHPTCKNIVTDYGAVGDGVTDDITPFLNFRTFAQGVATNSPPETACLLLPAGYSFNFSSGFESPFSDIKVLEVDGYGATMQAIRGTSYSGFPNSGTGADQVYLQQVTVGATSATVVTPGDAAKFTVGKWAALTALEMQDGAGYPPNHHLFQWVRVTNIAGNVISFTPAAANTYLTTFPDTSSVGYITGGPAMLFDMVGRTGFGNTDCLDTAWDSDIHVKGVTFNNTYGEAAWQIYWSGKRTRLTDCTFVNCAFIPTANHYFGATRCSSMYNEVEIDKECDLVEFDDCDIHTIHCQSSSVQQFNLRNSRVNAMRGTPRNTLIENTRFNVLRIGCEGYGFSETVVLRNVITPILEPQQGSQLNRSDFTVAGGGATLTFTGNYIDGIRFLIPGSHWYFSRGGGGGPSNNGSPFTITGVTQIAGPALVATTTLTSMPPNDSERAVLIQLPTASLTATGCSGCQEMLDASGAAPGSFMLSYSRRTGDFVDPTGPGGEGLFMFVWGRVTSVTVNVSTAYTGAQSTATMEVTYRFFDLSCVDYTAWTFSSWGITINTKIAGTRTFTPGSTTGLQTGDQVRRGGSSVANIGNVWCQGGILPKNETNMIGDTLAQRPVIDIIIQTDQSS